MEKFQVQQSTVATASVLFIFLSVIESRVQNPTFDCWQIEKIIVKNTANKSNGNVVIIRQATSLHSLTLSPATNHKGCFFLHQQITMISNQHYCLHKINIYYIKFVSKFT